MNNTFCFVYYHYSTFSFFGGIRHLVPAAVHRWRWLPASIFWWLSFFFLVWFHCVCWNNNRLLCSFWMTWLSVLSVESWLDANWILEVVWVFLCCCYRCCCSISRKIPLETMDSSLPATSLDDILIQYLVAFTGQHCQPAGRGRYRCAHYGDYQAHARLSGKLTN